MSSAGRLLMLIVTGVTILSGCKAPEEKKLYPHAILTPEPPRSIPDAKLVFGDGTPVSGDWLVGHWTWLYFGFANCPDVCPMALEFAAREYGRIRRKDQVQVVFVSVDPDRDRSPKLKSFVTFYHPDFLGVTGTRKDIDTLAQAVGASYVIDKPAVAGGAYNVSHSNMVFILNPQGQLSAVYAPGIPEGQMAEDFDHLLGKEKV
ncbi:MAG: SCO family protein [Candidatus Sericytochromatia bacterium]|nr:SCO family protein [Candidatus Sericytochromatia bacterium]